MGGGPPEVGSGPPEVGGGGGPHDKFYDAQPTRSPQKYHVNDR